MTIVGIDEVGRGCWAGPVVAGAVVLDRSINGLKDSKLLTRRQRERLALAITVEASSFGLGWVDAKTVDEIGLSSAVALAMMRSLEGINLPYDQVLIDGNVNYLPDNPKVKTLIKADALVPAVSAASIIAKVARDHFMIDAAAQFPKYGFEKHVGYGTALHLEQLKIHGICDLHRRSFKPVQQFVN